MSHHILVAGDAQNPKFQEACELAEDLQIKLHNGKVEILELFEMEWVDKLEELQRLHPVALGDHDISQPLLWNVTSQSSFGSSGALRDWATQTLGVALAPTAQDAAEYERRAQQRFQDKMTASKREYVFMDFDLPNVGVGNFIIELFNEICPKTCANFRALCTGERGASAQTGKPLHYLNTPIHRVMPGGWIQGGDISSGRGDGGESIYGARFDDECFDVRHTQRGLVGMASSKVHDNGSQFYVTLRALPTLDGKKVLFGRVVVGFLTLNALSSYPCNNQRPTPPVRIIACGLALAGSEDAAAAAQ